MRMCLRLLIWVSSGLRNRRVDLIRAKFLTCWMWINSLAEDASSAKVLGKNGEYYGVGLWILFAFINHSCDLKCEALVCGGRDHIPLPGCALAMKQAQGYEAVVSAARVPKAAAFVAELKRSGGGAVESESNLSVYRRIPPVLGDHERSHQLIALTQILAFGYSFLDINIAPATSSAKFSLVFFWVYFLIQWLNGKQGFPHWHLLHQTCLLQNFSPRE